MPVPFLARVLVVASALAVAVVGVGVTAAPASAATRDISRFACAPGLTTGFGDVAGTTHAHAIACAVHYELTGGTSATTYSPQLDVSRGQLATFLVRLLGFQGLRVGEFPSARFTDTAGTPHEASIDALVELGIARGTSPTTFSPTLPVSRAQLATFLRAVVEFLGFDLPPNAPNAFDDDDGTTHEAAIDAMAAAGIAEGTAARRFEPRRNVTRGAMASFLVRVVDLGIEEGFYAPKVAAEAFAALVGGGATGTAVIYTTDVPNVLCYEILLEGVGQTSGASVKASAIDVPLPVPQPDGFTGGCVSDPDARAVLADPNAARVEVAAAQPVAGNLGERGAGGIGELEDLQVVPGPGDRNAFGIAAVFATSQPGVLCASVGLLASSTPTAVHLHAGAPHTNGAVVADFGPVEPFGVPIACRETGVAGDLVADPRGFYVDVHTVGHPGGALRGQLEPATV